MKTRETQPIDDNPAPPKPIFLRDIPTHSQKNISGLVKGLLGCCLLAWSSAFLWRCVSGVVWSFALLLWPSAFLWSCWGFRQLRSFWWALPGLRCFLKFFELWLFFFHFFLLNEYDLRGHSNHHVCEKFEV